MKLMSLFFAVPAAAITFAALAALRSPSPPSPTPAKPPVPPPSGAFHKPSDADLRKKLTPLQYEVTQQSGTERAFSNQYWDNKKPGIYVDIVSGEVLFSSLEKFDSGTGWPSFWKPLEEGNIKTGENISFVGKWAEVRSAQADSHLGHVFDDGPPPTHLRYCMNSAAMRFIPVEDLEKEGYGKYKVLFEKP
jgi:methionine-R-sulfoxide reductase